MQTRLVKPMATINNNNKRSQSSPKVKRAVNAKSVTVKAIKSSENPFDKFSNNRKKFEVVNRRVKGEDRNVGRARAKVHRNPISNRRFIVIDLVGNR